MATTDSVARIIALSAMGGGGVSEVDYSKATNKPRINGNELVGDKTSTDLALASIEAISNVVYEPSTGIMTFEKENGTSFNIDLPLELLIKSGSYDATTKEILLELANGDIIRINVGDLVDTYFGDEETIELFQEGGENKFRVKETLLTKIYDELNKRLKYKGHVNSKEDLPTAGQASGEFIAPNLSVSYLNGGYKSTVQKYYAKKQYFLSQYTNGGAYGVLSTDFPEIVDGVCLGFKPWGTTVFVHLNATGTKTAIIDYDASNQGMVDYDDGSAWDKTKSTTITKSAWVALYRAPGYEGSFSGNFPNPIKFKIPSKDTFIFANGTDSVDVNYQSLTNNNFTYNSGYKLFEFPSDKSFEWVTTTPSDINENDVYTVGPNYDLVRGNAVEQKWEPLSASVSIEEIDNHIDEKITAIPVNNLLHFKGHVNSKEDLPTAGQASGEIIDRKTVINSTKYDAFQNPSEDIKTKIRNNKKEGYNYFIGTLYGALNTNFPEIIEGVTIFNQWNSTSYLNMIVRVNASTSKPCVWVSGYPNTIALMKNGLFDDGTPVQADFGELLIMQPAWIVMADTYTSSLYVLGNIPEPIKYKYTDIEQMPFATNMSDSPSGEMIRYTNIKSIVTDGFVYNPGYKLFGFNDDETPYWITTTGSDINENDVYTMGPNYDLVRGNAAEQKWEPLAPKSIEIDNNTITLSSENKIQTRAIIDKNTNNANSFWTGTKAEYDALGVYDENTFYAITDEAASMQSALTEVSGYDAAKTQILKNINGTLTWVDSQ